MVMQAAMCAVILAGASMTSAESDGMAYSGRAPGAYFGDPTPISDRDESSTSQSSFRIAQTAEPETDVRSRDILVGTYTVAPNPSLGYAYAGFAVPFNTPMALQEDAAFQFDARSAEGVERLELVLRDTSRRRATQVVTLAPSTSWTTITVPASQLASIDKAAVESAAIVVLSPGSGRLEISNMRLPVRSPVTEQTILEEIRSAPKWHVDATMAMHVARRLQSPLLILEDLSDAPSREVLQGEEWHEVLAKTVNLRLRDEELLGLPADLAAVRDRTPGPRVYVFSPTGELLAQVPVSPEPDATIRAALSQWIKGDK
jgi:hypothetical protein